MYLLKLLVKEEKFQFYEEIADLSCFKSLKIEVGILFKLGYESLLENTVLSSLSF